MSLLFAAVEVYLGSGNSLHEVVGWKSGAGLVSGRVRGCIWLGCRCTYDMHIQTPPEAHSTKLLAMVPQPVKAVVLLFPITEKNEAKKKDEDEAILTGKLPPVDPTVIWIKQTVSNNKR